MHHNNSRPDFKAPQIKVARNKKKIISAINEDDYASKLPEIKSKLHTDLIKILSSVMISYYVHYFAARKAK